MYRKRMTCLCLLLLVAIVAFGRIPAHAAEIVASGKCGNAVSWSLDAAGTLTISGKGPMEDLESSKSSPWFDKDAWQYLNVVTVIIENGVTSVGANAFSYCSSVQTVVLPESVTVIGLSAFQGCDGLVTVQMDAKLTSIGASAFEGCMQLANFSIPQTVCSIGDSAFFGCAALEQIVLPECATDIGPYAFASCSSLRSVTLPSTMTCIPGCMFKGCGNLTEVQIPQNVTVIGAEAFSDCRSLTHIDLPAGVTQIGNDAFFMCVSITEVVIPEGVTTIDFGAFAFCTNLKQITIPQGVTNIGAQAFIECTNLTQITIPNSVTKIGQSAFQGCSLLNAVWIPSSVKEIHTDAFAECSGLWHVLYLGTTEEWDRIHFQENNEALTNAVRHDGCNGNEILNDQTKRCSACCTNGIHVLEEKQIPATCTADGVHKTVCTECNEAISETIIPATGHTFGQWTVTKKPELWKEGETCRSCACGEAECQPIPQKLDAVSMVIAAIAVVLLGAGVAAGLYLRKKRRNPPM